jgi:TRAP transporter TAXI family solute receptor
MFFPGIALIPPADLRAIVIAPDNLIRMPFMHRSARPFVVGIITLVLPILFLNGSASAESKPTLVTLGTATKGGGFQLFGQNLAEVINATDSSLKVEEIATKGSKENLPFLEEGKINVALVEGNAAREALDGIGRQRANLKVLSVMYPNPGMFVVRADSPYRSINDLKGKPIAFGTKASGLRILAGDVLDGLGMKPDREFQQIILEKAGDGPTMVLEKKAEALWGAGIGWPGFVKVAKGPAGARFIAPSAGEINRILAKHPHLKAMSVPAGTYAGQTEQVDSVGLWSLILVRPDMSNDDAYRLARAIHKGEAALAARLQQGAYTTAANTVAQVQGARLHPGAARYYREAGLLK